MKAEDKIAKIQDVVITLANMERAYKFYRQQIFDTHPNLTLTELYFMATIYKTIDSFEELIQELRKGIKK